MTVEEYNRAVDTYADNLYRFVLKNLREEHMSRDIVQETFEMNQIDEPLTQLVNIDPIFPARAKRRGIEGLVEVEFVVNKQGEVETVSIVNSDPPDVFDKAVINSISKWRFKPGTIAGIPVKTRVKKPIQFNLGD